MIKIFAEEEKAKRIQLLWGSSLLATQYLINATSTETPEELKDIYKFLAGVNMIVIGYSYFYKQKYEKFYYSKTALIPKPMLFGVPSKKKVIAGLGLSFKF